MLGPHIIEAVSTVKLLGIYFNKKSVMGWPSWKNISRLSKAMDIWNRPRDVLPESDKLLVWNAIVQAYKLLLFSMGSLTLADINKLFTLPKTSARIITSSSFNTAINFSLQCLTSFQKLSIIYFQVLHDTNVVE